MKINGFADDVLMGQAAAEYIEKLIISKIERGGTFILALSGGRSPETTYACLTKKNIDWRKVYIILTDERFVPKEHPDSNYKMINDIFISRINIPLENIISPDTSLINAEKCAKSHELQLKKLFRFKENHNLLFPSIDLVCLGIGDDGHTASLFPGDNSLNENKKWILNTKAPENFPVKNRITFTLPLINNADHAIFIVSGKNKRKIIEKVRLGEKNLPANLVKTKNETVLFLDNRSIEY